MYSCMDVVGLDLQPIQDNNPAGAFLIILFICLGPFFVLNIVVGVIIEKFNQVSGRAILTDEQKLYRDTLMSVITADSSPMIARPENAIRARCFDLCTSPFFEGSVLVLIVANSVLMGMEHCGEAESWTSLMGTLNYVFVGLFTLELSIRLVAIDIKIFFNDAWNILDFVVVTGCLLMIPLDGVVNLNALRPFRLFVLFRIVKRARGLKLMVSALFASVPALFNISTLLFLCFFVYAILGMQLFGNVKFGEFLNENANFRSFGSAMLMLMRVVTGESWNFIMKDCQISPPQCTDFNGPTTAGIGDTSLESAETVPGYYLMNDCGNSWLAVIYFITFYIMSNYTVIISSEPMYILTLLFSRFSIYS